MDNTINQSFLPKISVVVPVYNGEADLPDLINCLRSQFYPPDRVEYLLVDNNSSDRTAAILETATSLGLTIRHLTENQIQSSYAARNAGIRASTGEIIAFTDADCRPLSNWLDELTLPFVNPAIGVVAGEIVALPGNTLLEKHSERGNVLSAKYTLEHPFYPYGQTANLAIRRQIFEQVGLFRPYLTTGGDADICWRIQTESDAQLHFAPTAIVQHRHRNTLRELKSQWRRYGCSNRYLHELHGVDLMRDLSILEYIYIIGRWLFKEVPVSGVKTLAGKATLVDMLSTPIGLFSVRARAVGQRTAKLPDLARKIDWL